MAWFSIANTIANIINYCSVAQILKHAILDHLSTYTNFKASYFLSFIHLHKFWSTPYSIIIHLHRSQSISSSIIYLLVQILKYSILYHLSIYKDFEVLHPLSFICLYKSQSSLSSIIHSFCINIKVLYPLSSIHLHKFQCILSSIHLHRSLSTPLSNIHPTTQI